MNILKYLLLIFLLLLGCSTNKKIIRDSRTRIIKADKWEMNFLQKDSGSGIIFDFIRDKSVIRKSKGINMLLWAYPLDTISIVKRVYDELQPMPSGGFADVTYIDYKIKNDTIKISAVVDSTNQIFKEIIPNTYLLLINSYGFSPMYLRDIIVRQGYWSIIKVSMYEPPINYY